MQKSAKTPQPHRRAKWIGGIAGLLAVILAAGLLLCAPRPILPVAKAP